MGDFYEIFGVDAEDVAPKLELVLTSRERGDKSRIPFCGVPHHSARNYWLKLLKMGYRVAIADQVESPEDAKGLVRREIVQVYTSGCIEDLEGLESDSPNYLMGIYECPHERTWALSIIDVSTGDFRLGNLDSYDELSSYIKRFRPRELLVRKFLKDELESYLDSYRSEFGLSVTALPEAALRDKDYQRQLVNDKFSTQSIESLPCGKVLGVQASSRPYLII